MSTKRGMDKEDVVHIYNRILLSHKSEQNNGIYINMNVPRDLHTEWSKLDKNDKYHMILFICRIFFKKDTNELIYKQRESYRCKKQTYGYQG